MANQNDIPVEIEPSYIQSGELPQKVQWLIDMAGDLTFKQVYDGPFIDVVQHMLDRVDVLPDDMQQQATAEGEALKAALQKSVLANPSMGQLYRWDKNNLTPEQQEVWDHSRALQNQGLFNPYLDLPASLIPRIEALFNSDFLKPKAQGGMGDRPVKDLYLAPAKPGGIPDPHLKFVTKAKKAGLFGYHPYNAYAAGWHCEHKANDQACLEGQCISNEFTEDLFCSQTADGCSLESDPYPA